MTLLLPHTHEVVVVRAAVVVAVAVCEDLNVVAAVVVVVAVTPGTVVKLVVSL